MEDSELLAILNSQISNCDTVTSDDSKKATAIDYYMGDTSIIDTDEGESSIITREVLENVERELGQQLKVFTSGGKIVEFDPTSEEDEEGAEQETDYVNYIFSKENDGFKITHDWLKSALLEEVSYVQAWVEEKEEVTTETYAGLTDGALEQLLSQEGVEPIEHDQIYIDAEGAQVDVDGVDPQYLTVLQTLHEVKVKVTSKGKIIKIENIPNEEMGVQEGWNKLSLKDCPFVYRKPSGITESDLIEAGFDKGIVSNLPSYTDNLTELDFARDKDDSQLRDSADSSTREIEVYKCYIMMDYEEDGISSLREVTMSGTTILDNEPCDGNHIATLCPVPMPHKHGGLSYADMLIDVQDVKTVLMQQMLTNLYLTNSPEREVVEDECNIEDLLTSKSGSIKRVKQPGMIRDLTVPFTAGQSLPMLDVLDNMASNRVGSTKNLDPNVLAQTTGMAFAIADGNDSATSEKLARIFAETGFKELFKILHELAIKNIDQEKIVRLRNKYVPVNPSEWKHRANMSVVVGLGTGNTDKEMGALVSIATKQEEHLMQGSPLVSAKNLYNTYEKIIERAGLKEASRYWIDPESPEAQQAAQEKAQQPPPEDPNMIMIQANKAIEDQKAQLVSQKQQQDAFFKKQEQDLKERELAVREIEAGVKTELEVAKLEQQRYEADLKSESQLAIEQMKLGATLEQVMSNSVSDMSIENDQRLTDMINTLLGEINTISSSNMVGMEEMTEGMKGQVEQLAMQMARDKVVDYDTEGNPVRIRTEQ